MIFIYIFFFLIAFWFKYKKSGFSTTVFLLLIYLISSISAAILLYGDNQYYYSTITLPSVLFNLSCLTLFFAPLVAFDNFDIRKVRFPNSQLMKIFAWVIIILCFSSLISSFEKGIKVFSIADLNQARQAATSGEIVVENRIFLISYLGGYGTQLSLYALILYFYFKKFIPNTIYIQILLFISSFQIIIISLAGVGRDGVIWWIIFFIFCLVLFRQVFTRNEYKWIIINVLLIFSPFIFIFIAITISRAQNDNIFLFILDYIGQPFINFSRIFSDFTEPTFYGRLNFSFFFPSSEAISPSRLWVAKSSGDLNIFATFVGSFIIDFGAYILLLIALLYFLIAKFSFKIRRGSISFTQLIMYCWFLQVFLLGVFYYMFTNPSCIRVFFILLFTSYLMQQINSRFNRVN